MTLINSFLMIMFFGAGMFNFALAITQQRPPINFLYSLGFMILFYFFSDKVYLKPIRDQEKRKKHGTIS